MTFQPLISHDFWVKRDAAGCLFDLLVIAMAVRLMSILGGMSQPSLKNGTMIYLAHVRLVSADAAGFTRKALV